MTMYGLNALNGLANAYLLLLYWGFSAGPTNYLPYVVLTASLLLHFVCTVISLFRPKINALISTVCSLVILFWQSHLITDALNGGKIGILMFLLLVGSCWTLIFKAIKILIDKEISWASPNVSVKERWKPVFLMLPFSVLLLYLL
ncbi:hypothetical protein [Dyadobacter sediminis]|uniref:Uncharacterized protein n=1 Tax=Dyadobacter sediminis TaxID=1493691 RepID=A0A5R9KB83_9BACT|nr:hypothetical protein [Dyadobacter sediminis]TLU92022.1 hypothetical protein FEM55_14780 [Dyadobacter sediminis]